MVLMLGQKFRVFAPKAPVRRVHALSSRPFLPACATKTTLCPPTPIIPTYTERQGRQDANCLVRRPFRLLHRRTGPAAPPDDILSTDPADAIYELQELLRPGSQWSRSKRHEWHSADLHGKQ